MTIKIEMYGVKWRISIENEVWEFETLEGMEQELSKLLKQKNEFGRIKK